MLLHEHQQVFFFDVSFDMKFTINDFFFVYFLNVMNVFQMTFREKKLRSNFKWFDSNVF